MPTWQNGRKVQAIAWITATSMAAFVGLTIFALLHPEGDGRVLMASLAFLSTQAAAGTSFLMGSSMPEQGRPHSQPVPDSAAPLPVTTP